MFSESNVILYLTIKVKNSHLLGFSRSCKSKKIKNRQRNQDTMWIWARRQGEINATCDIHRRVQRWTKKTELSGKPSWLKRSSTGKSQMAKGQAGCAKIPTQSGDPLPSATRIDESFGINGKAASCLLQFSVCSLSVLWWMEFVWMNTLEENVVLHLNVF